MIQVSKIVSDISIKLSKCGLAGVNLLERTGELSEMVNCRIAQCPLTYLGSRMSLIVAGPSIFQFLQGWGEGRGGEKDCKKT